MIKRGRTFYSRRGFTIVELLIVIVVIAILAAITVVAFTGIQNRAKESASSNETAQVAKKLATYYSVNGELYPSALTDPALSLSDANLVPSPYEYTVSSDQKEFCVTLTMSGVAPASTQSAGVNVNRDTATTPAVGDVYYADNVFFSAQPAAFADGSTPGWFWQGEANNSISYGIPL